MIKSITPAFVCLTALLFLMSCNDTNKAESDAADVKARAIVNGNVITEQEVMQQLKRDKDHDAFPELKLRREQALLDSMVQQELAAQRAKELGLDKDPAYVAQLQRITTQLDAFKRDKLSKLFESSEIRAKAIITDADIDRYIADNEVSVRFESHILQITQLDPEKIQQVSDQLASGKSFDEVAREVFPKMPDDKIRPWDRGFLKWEQIPGAWTDTLANMQPGETSDIIKGPGRSFWIIHLVDRRSDDTFDMASRRLRIRQILQHEKIRQMKEVTMQALIDPADIDYAEAHSSEVLATVSGSPITRQDVLYRINKNGRDESDLEPSPTKIKKTLEGIIRQELASHKARELGLDTDAAYQEQLGRLQAQLANFKRKKLSERFFKQEVNLKAEATDAEALAYATENASRLQTQVKVWQILHKDRKQIEQVQADLARGESFESVAARRFPDLPKSLPNPWELGYLNWDQIPDPWWDSLNNLAVGEISGIIKESNKRYWIIKLVDKRDFTEYNFETAKPKIKAILKQDKVKELRETTISSLRENARIVFPAP